MSRAGEARLGDIAESVAYGFTATASTVDTGVRFLRTTDLSRDSLDWPAVPFCEISTQELAKHRLLAGDIVISRMGTVGLSALVNPPQNAVPASYLVRFRLYPEMAHSPFVAYVLRSPMWWAYVESRRTGSVQPNLNARLMADFRFPLPPVPQQRAIAGVLGALDDKIESNRRRARIAHCLSRAEFAYIVSGSPTTEIQLGDLVDLKYGKALAEGERRPGRTPVYGSAGVTGFHDESLVAGPVIVLGRKGRPGTVFLSFVDCWPIDTTFWLVPKREVSMAWLYLAVEQMDLGRFGADSAVPGLNREMAERDVLLLPDSTGLRSIHDAVWPLLLEEARADAESEQLAILRDALLPELLSGRLRVRDAEDLVESAP